MGKVRQNMADCNSCGGKCDRCASCGGCSGNELALCGAEMDMLIKLGQIPFLPVARKASDMVPVYLEEGDQEENAWVLQMLEKKQLIDIRYDPLPGADMSAYAGYPVHGSMALTARGQQVLELLEIQGYQE